MVSKTIFRGAATALITPTNESGIDYDAFGRVIDWQIEQGIDALVIAGTTGEGALCRTRSTRKPSTFP